jgi:RNA polymerase sigma-70 factor (ECF subfamily)
MDGSPAASAVSIDRRRVSDATTSFAALIEGQLDRSYRLAAVILGNALEAEDVVADASLLAWRSRGRLRDPARFEAWFARIVVNVCRDRLRTRRRQPIDQIAPVPIEEVTSVGPGSDFRDDVHRRDVLNRAFETLGADDRIVLALRFWLDLPVDAIAERLAIPAGTVKSRLHHATGRLREALEGGEEDR